MSNLALKLIEKEKRERTGKLDLGYCGLTELPEELFELNWLEELNLCNAYVDFTNDHIHSNNIGTKNNLINEKNYVVKIFHPHSGVAQEHFALDDCSSFTSILLF